MKQKISSGAAAAAAAATTTTRRNLSSLPMAEPVLHQLFRWEGWPRIVQDLNKCPTFTCADERGQPLEYMMGAEQPRQQQQQQPQQQQRAQQPYSVPLFFCDVDDAEEELQRAKRATGSNSLGIIPFPLGQAFEMSLSGQAMLVPNNKAMVQAGAPPDINPIGTPVPLFACPEIMISTNDDGSDAVLPVFMTLEDCEAVILETVDRDGGSVDDFEVVSLTLNRAVELLTNVPETPAFQFVAPEKSFAYINEFLDQSP